MTRSPTSWKRVDIRAYRLLVLRAHYRSPLEVSPGTTAALERLDNLARRAAEASLEGSAPDADSLERFRTATDDDLDTPAAMALVFDLVRAANVALDAGDPAGAGPLVAAVLVDRRDQTRAGRDWVAADVLRTELEAKGWAVEDGAAGTRVRRC